MNLFPTTFRYIFKKIFLGMILLTTVLAASVWLAQSLRFLDMIVNRSVSLQGYFYLIGFLLPELVVLLLPICLLISAMYHYNKFSTDSELSVWRSCGMSDLQIASPALVLTLLMTVVVLFLNVFVIPKTFSHFKDHEYTLRQQFTGAMLQEGKFNNFQGVTAYVQQRFRSGRLKGVHIYNKQGSSSYTIIADEGRIELVDGKIQFFLKGGMRQERDPKTGKLNILAFESLHYDLGSVLKKEENRAIRPFEKSLKELLSPEASDEVRSKYRATGHLRILQPLFGLIYMLIALVTLLTGHFRRKGRHGAVAAGFVGAFLFHMMIISLVNMNGKVSWAISAAYGSYVFIMALLMFFFLRKQYGWSAAA